MKTFGQKIGELIDALDSGHILYKEYGDPAFDNKEYIFRADNGYELKGWGSALGDYNDRLLNIIKNPDSWKIFPGFNMNTHDYPYPWSSSSNKNS